MSPRARLAHWFVATCCALIACSGPDDPSSGLPPRHAFGRRLSIGFADGDRPCAGTIEALNAQLTGLEASLGLALRAPVALYFLNDAASVSRLCNQSERGKCYNWRLHAAFFHEPALDRDALAHELVHGFADQSGLGLQPSLLAEGLAVLFSTDSCASPKPSTTPVTTLLSLPPGSRLQNSEYALGALFLQWLFEEYGTQRAVSFLGSLRPTSGLSETDRTFRATFGESLQSASDRFATERPAFSTRFDRCATARELSESDSLTLNADLSCDNSQVRDVFESGSHRLQASFLLTVSERVRYQVIRADSRVDLSVTSCDCADGDDVSGYPTSPPATSLELAAGRYRLDLSVPQSAATTMARIELHRLEMPQPSP